MRGFSAFTLLLGCLAFSQGLRGDEPRADAPTVDFSRDIRPVLADACFVCHGPDEGTRESELRLDLKDSALGDLGGYRAIVPGALGESELYARLTDESEWSRMPPPDAPRQLTPEEIETIGHWIEQGASWQEHWSLVTPQRPTPPDIPREHAPINAIDHFIRARLTEERLHPSPPADKATLLRRVTLDLTGLPPTLEEIDAFLKDDSGKAYERVVDRLLASPRYGEHMTRDWLDLARYGDTHGLHLDNERSIWPYRDWLIRAFNQNMPFDQFTIEQLAGDLLPEPTLQQRIATGFNRCNVTTSEGGSIDEEYIVRYAVDRVETTSTVWLGLTTGCAACHDHKFDPISQKEFYQLFAFFNSTQDKPMDGNALLPPPVVQLPSAEQVAARKKLQREIARVEKRLKSQVANAEYEDPTPEITAKELKPTEYIWLDDALPSGAKPGGDGKQPWRFVAKADGPVTSGEKSFTRTTDGRSQQFFTGAVPKLNINKSDKFFAYVYLDPENPPREIMLQFNDGDWDHRAFWGEDLIDWGVTDTTTRMRIGDLPAPGKWVRLEVPINKVGFYPTTKINGLAFTQFGGTVHWDKAGIVTKAHQPGRRFASQRAWELVELSVAQTQLPKAIHAALKIEPEERNKSQRRRLRQHFLAQACSTMQEHLAPVRAELTQAKDKLQELQSQIPSTLVTAEMEEPREAFVLNRGEYDKPTDKVERNVPAVLPPLTSDMPTNRLGLARWLVDPGHPLTARVTVNRFWQHYFGTGLVETSEDFGTQGAYPSHPQLLDWLATEFVESGWDVKAIQKQIVMSATYRQASRISPAMYQADSTNRFLARGPRFRMDAEMVRDNALSISGLLVDTVGGPSVNPYQPLGLWKAVGYTRSNTANFKQDTGDALFRRSMYTFWKRTSPPPVMSLLDAPSRETCTARRARTNTPLAALALMNDIQFFEAARHLAERMMTEAGEEPEARITQGFRLATGRSPTATECGVLLEQYRTQLAMYRAEPASAVAAIHVGDSPHNESLDACELAAWTLVANVILNLDETLTKP